MAFTEKDASKLVNLAREHMKIELGYTDSRVTEEIYNMALILKLFELAYVPVGNELFPNLLRTLANILEIRIKMDD